MAKGGGWKLEVLGNDNGRVVRLVLEIGRGDEEETERELTKS